MVSVGTRWRGTQNRRTETIIITTIIITIIKTTIITIFKKLIKFVKNAVDQMEMGRECE